MKKHIHISYIVDLLEKKARLHYALVDEYNNHLNKKNKDILNGLQKNIYECEGQIALLRHIIYINENE